ncbi:MAG: serine hydrolase [Roseiflexaceae bacterium]
MTAKNTQDANHFDERLNEIINKIARKRRNQSPIQVHVAAPRYGINYHSPYSKPDQPFHVASIGKVFTAILILRMVERGQLKLSQPIHELLDAELLKGLFVYRGVDYTNQVTIGQLLNHTSGVADYFGANIQPGFTFLDHVVHHSEKLWTPSTLVDISRQFQQAVAKPGERFHYSDTGYILLGLIVQQVSDHSFHSQLHDEIFEPLGMEQSYLAFYSQPTAQPTPSILPMYVNDVDVSRFQSLSCDWAGGGIVSTPIDLVKFQRALQSGALISLPTWHQMTNCTNKFRSGLRYGMGMMEVQFEGLFFLLRGLPRMHGHIGIVATHMFSMPQQDLHVVINLGDTSQMKTSFKLLIDIMNLLRN